MNHGDDEAGRCPATCADGTFVQSAQPPFRPARAQCQQHRHAHRADSDSVPLYWTMAARNAKKPSDWNSEGSAASHSTLSSASRAQNARSDVPHDRPFRPVDEIHVPHGPRWVVGLRQAARRAVHLGGHGMDGLDLRRPDEALGLGVVARIGASPRSSSRRAARRLPARPRRLSPASTPRRRTPSTSWSSETACPAPPRRGRRTTAASPRAHRR